MAIPHSSLDLASSSRSYSNTNNQCSNKEIEKIHIIIITTIYYYYHYCYYYYYYYYYAHILNGHMFKDILDEKERKPKKNGIHYT